MFVNRYLPYTVGDPRMQYSRSFSEALNGLNLENVSLRVEQKEEISNIVVSNNDTDHFTDRLRAKSAIFTSFSGFYYW